MNILLTGGTGVAGLGTIPSLVAAGHNIRLLSRHADEDVKELPRGIDPFQADLGHAGDLSPAVKGCDVILHFAGIVEEKGDEITFEKVNVQGCARLLEACAAQTPRPTFVYLSSLGADRGHSEYHQSKLKAEKLVVNYPGTWIILRPGAIYGPGDETISLLLKMVRILPAVPMVGEGQQNFQPIWYRDLGYAIARLLERPASFAGAVWELAGSEKTTTDAILERLARVTGREPARLSVPAWLAQGGTKALEAFGGAGQSMLKALGITPPINSEKLDMLLEGNVIQPGRKNLADELGLRTTGLDEGLKQLVNLVPEQLPGSGTGAIRTGEFWADLVGSKYSARSLLDEVCRHIDKVMPIDFSAEPLSSEKADEGDTLTAKIEGRGNVQVRLEEKTETRATFVTLESHPLAGVMQLETAELSGGVRFTVRTLAQPADALDWVAMRTIGEPLQHRNWRGVVRHVVELSGGEAKEGVQEKSGSLSEEEEKQFERWVRVIVQRRKRADLEKQVEEAKR